MNSSFKRSNQPFRVRDALLCEPFTAHQVLSASGAGSFSARLPISSTNCRLFGDGMHNRFDRARRSF